MNEGVINLFAVAALVVVALASGFIGYMAADIRNIVRAALVMRKLRGGRRIEPDEFSVMLGFVVPPERDEPGERRTRD